MKYAIYLIVLSAIGMAEAAQAPAVVVPTTGQIIVPANDEERGIEARGIKRGHTPEVIQRNLRMYRAEQSKIQSGEMFADYVKNIFFQKGYFDNNEIKRLLPQNANANFVDSEGRTALLYIVKRAKDMWAQSTSFALEQRVERLRKQIMPILNIVLPRMDAQFINQKERLSGRTALIIAAMIPSEFIVRALLDAGADRTLTDKDGKTALQHAHAAGSVEEVKPIVEALRVETHAAPSSLVNPPAASSSTNQPVIRPSDIQPAVKSIK